MKALIKSDLPITLIKDLGMMYATAAKIKLTRMAEFECSVCTKTFTVEVSRVKNGKCSKCRKCGKLNNIAKTKKANTTHGLKNHALYSTWRDQKKKCNSKTDKSYCWYGERGIKMAQYWEKDFKSWLEYVISLEGYLTPTYTLDRIDNDKNYEIGNLRWASKEVQARNDRVIMSTNTSGYRGVSFDTSYGKWKTKIGVSGNAVHLGYHDTSHIAAIAYDTYVINNKLEHNINGVKI